MSLQKDEVAPPTPAAVKHQRDAHKSTRAKAHARYVRKQEIAEAKALGVNVVTRTSVDRTWTEEEEEVLRQLYPFYEQILSKLPHRSYNSVLARCSIIGLVVRQPRFTVKEVEILKRLWVKSTVQELSEALPRWSLKALHGKAVKLGLKPRGKPPIALTGDPLCDAIRDRCRELGYSMAYLDRIARTGTYFLNKHWTRKGGHIWGQMIKAAKALGGELHVEWPD